MEIKFAEQHIGYIILNIRNYFIPAAADIAKILSRTASDAQRSARYIIMRASNNKESMTHGDHFSSPFCLLRLQTRRPLGQKMGLIW
jgi:hypothetical protein